MSAADVLQQAQAKAKREALEAAMLLQFKAVGIEVEQQHRFHPTRKWRLDFIVPSHRIALEVEGGSWTGGRHTRGTGFAEDCRKQAEAVMLGWRYLRASGDQVKSGEALRWVEALMKYAG